MKNIIAQWVSTIDNRYTNFGDILSPYILQKYDINLKHSNENHELYTIGSLLHMVPNDYKGYIWSTGYMYPTKTLNLKHDPICVRGKLSKKHFINDTSNTYIGDGGLLLEKIYKPVVKQKYKLGIMPNYCDIVNMRDNPIEKFDIMKRDDVLFIDPRDYIETVINNICSCENILTSSLHGLVTCDSYGINHGIFGARETNLAIHHYQDSFKFRDYYSIFDMDFDKNKILNFDNSTSFEKCLTQCKPSTKPTLNNIQYGLEKSIEILKTIDFSHPL